MVLFLVFAPALPPTAYAQDTKAKNEQLPLSEAHRKWLEEEVALIISDVERDAFRSLGSDDDRDKFIEAFWQWRDPTPGTEKNEFKEEHYKRLADAERRFSRDTSRPGWQTDRGRIYVLLGEPRFKSDLTGSMLIYDTELWHYFGVTSYGLPSSIYVIFYRPFGVGEMRLFSPTTDGLEKLFKPLDYVYNMGAEELTDLLYREVDSELSHAVWSLIPNEGGLANERFAPNPLGSEMMLARIADARNYPENSSWVKNFAAYRTAVTVEYTFLSQPPGTLFTWFQNPQGELELHYAVNVQPEDFALGKYKERIYGSVTLEGYLSDAEGTVLAPLRNHSEFDVRQDEVKLVEEKPFEYQGLLPVIPAEIKYALIWKNEVSHQRMSIAGELNVPSLGDAEGPLFSPPVIVRSVTRLDPDEAERSVRPFQNGRILLEPIVGGRVEFGPDFVVFAQLIVPRGVELAVGDYELEFRIYSGGAVALSQRKPLSGFTGESTLADSMGIFQNLPTGELPGGDLQLCLALMKGETEVARSDRTKLTVGKSEIPPWVIRRGAPPYNKGYHNLVRAEQWQRSGKAERAREELNAAVSKEPSLVGVRVSLMRVSLREKHYDDVIAFGEPLLVEHPREVDLLMLVASAYLGQGRHKDAARLLERAYFENPKNLNILNLLANASFVSGNLERALEITRQSLKLRPDQPDMLKLEGEIESSPR